MEKGGGEVRGRKRNEEEMTGREMEKQREGRSLNKKKKDGNGTGNRDG